MGFFENNDHQLLIDRLTNVEENFLELKTRFPKCDIKLREAYKIINSLHTVNEHREATTVYKSIRTVLEGMKEQKIKFKIRDVLGEWIHSQVKDQALFDSSLVGGNQEYLRVRPSDILNVHVHLNHL